MSNFIEYLDPSPTLENRVGNVFAELRVSEEQQEAIFAFLHPIKVKDRTTHDHCLRVGLLAMHIGDFIRLDSKALLYAGLLHDVGKAQTKLETLRQTDVWTPADAEEIKAHVTDGYRLL